MEQTCETEQPLNAHLIGKKVKFVYEGDDWHSILPNEILTISRAGILNNGGTADAVEIPAISVKNSFGIEFRVSVEEAFFKFKREDEPLFVFVDEA